METQREASASALPLQGVVHLKLPTFLAATRHSLALGLARSIREPRLRGGYALQRKLSMRRGVARLCTG